MPWPFVKDSMPNAPRGQGNLGTSGGGKPSMKPMPYVAPKGPRGPTGTPGMKSQVHKSGSQDCSR